jgi:hypothetical protein
MQRRLLPLLSLLLTVFGCGGDSGSYYVYEVRISNISDAQTTLIASDGTAVPIAFSPVAWAVHSPGSTPIFRLTEAASDPGLRQLAENGDVASLAAALQTTDGVSLVGVVSETQQDSGILGPGDTYRFLISAEKGKRLSFAASFLQGNDLFIGLSELGIPLFQASGEQLSGDITSEVFLYDAGTEVNEEPGLGANQAPRQSVLDAGVRENGVVGFANDGFQYPEISRMLKIEITPVDEVPTS